MQSLSVAAGTMVVGYHSHLCSIGCSFDFEKLDLGQRRRVLDAVLIVGVAVGRL